MGTNEVKKYTDLKEEQIRWIAGLQENTTSGCIPLSHAYDRDIGYSVNPYFSNLAAKAFLLNTRYKYNCKKYIEWFFKELKNIMYNNVTYTCIADSHVLKDGTHIYSNMLTYDSIDSYLTTFLSLLAEYTTKTNDTSFITQNSNQIIRMVNTIDKLYQQNYCLTIAKPEYPMIYLMDNCEVYRGLKDIQPILNRFSNIYKSTSIIISKILVGILRELKKNLYNDKTDLYKWALNTDSNLSLNFYPNVLCQFYPFLYNIDNSITRWKNLSNKIIKTTPEINSLKYKDTLMPHCEIWYLAAKKYSNTINIINPFLMHNAYEERVKNNYYYIYCHEAGYAARAYAEMVKLS